MRKSSKSGRSSRAFLFDLDGTLVDNVYQHVLAWHEAFQSAGIDVSLQHVHRRIGMAGDLFVRALLRELDREIGEREIERLEDLHAKSFARLEKRSRALPGARELLAYLTERKVPWAIATSGKLESAKHALSLLDPGPDATIITRDDVKNAKPEPDLFLAAADRLGVDIADAVVLGDSVWDLLAARRARALGVGLLSGGTGREELERAGAYRVYGDPTDLLAHIDEIGVIEAG